MAKSLGDYNIEKSSSSDLKNIKWIQKNPVDMDKLKSKKKTTRTTSPFNVIYTQETEKVQPPVKKVFKIIEVIDIEKSKNAFAYFTEIFKRGIARGYGELYKKKGDPDGIYKHISIEGSNEGDGIYNI